MRVIAVDFAGRDLDASGQVNAPALFGRLIPGVDDVDAFDCEIDAGARFTGEFSLGFNPYILNPMCDILFDEKIAGSLHLTPGQAYKECDNGNRSAVHWDMVLIQRPEWGGGEIWFDDELIRKNGLFLPTDLKPLNPSNLK